MKLPTSKAKPVSANPGCELGFVKLHIPGSEDLATARRCWLIAVREGVGAQTWC